MGFRPIESFNNQGEQGGETNPNTGAALKMDRQNQFAVFNLNGAQPPLDVEILDGAITPSGARVLVDTEAQSAADELTIINKIYTVDYELHEGMIVYLRAKDAARKITVKNSASENGIQTASGQDLVLSATQWEKFQFIAGVWVQDVDSLQTMADGKSINLDADSKLSVKTYKPSDFETPLTLEQEELPAGLKALAEAGKGSIAGTVVAFAGTFSGKNPIPLGETEADLTWQICDGTNGTPNLVDKFIYGGDGTTQGTEGGDVVTEGHTLTVDELASHSHVYRSLYQASISSGSLSRWIGSGTTAPTELTGGSQPHAHNQNLPPHLVLAYIMKLPQA